jgi:hypothetical protein
MNEVTASLKTKNKLNKVVLHNLFLQLLMPVKDGKGEINDTDHLMK